MTDLNLNLFLSKQLLLLLQVMFDRHSSPLSDTADESLKTQSLFNEKISEGAGIQRLL